MSRDTFKSCWLALRLVVIASVLSACSLNQTHSTVDHQTFSLGKGDLVKYGLAFITPSTVTGQEACCAKDAEHQALGR